MPFCPKCGKEVPEKAVFCPFCGTEITSTQKKPGHRRRVVGMLVGLGALAALGFVAYRYYGSELRVILDELMEKLCRKRTETFTKPLKTLSKSSETTFPSATTSPPITSPSTTTVSTPPPTSLTAVTTSAATAQTTITVSDLPSRDWSITLTPYLFAGGQAYRDEIRMVAMNNGDASAYNAVLELYGGPYPRIDDRKWIDHPLNSFHLLWREVAVLHPGQRAEFKFTASEHWPEMLIWLAYDPILDPKGFRMDSSDHVRSIFRNSKERDRHVIAVGRHGEVGEW